MGRKKALTKKAPKAESTLHDFLIPAITRQVSIKQSDQHRLRQDHPTAAGGSGGSIRVLADLDGPSSRRNQFHPNAQRNLQALVPKRFVFKKKRPKGLSRLKKRILLVGTVHTSVCHTVCGKYLQLTITILCNE